MNAGNLSSARDSGVAAFVGQVVNLRPIASAHLRRFSTASQLNKLLPVPPKHPGELTALTSVCSV